MLGDVIVALVWHKLRWIPILILMGQV